MNLQDISFNEIKYFLPEHNGKQGVPIRGVMAEAGKRILINFILENISSLAYYGVGATEPDIYLLGDVLPKCKIQSDSSDNNLVCFELSTNKQVVFCGGSAPPAQQGQKPQALITAINFSKDLKPIDEIILKDGDPSVVTSIKRASNEDILFVGGIKHVYVLEWKQNKFNLLMMALDIHSGYIFDMCIFGKRLYSVGKKDRFISILDFSVEL